MADTKRNNAGSKTATSKTTQSNSSTSPAPVSDHVEALSKAHGARYISPYWRTKWYKRQRHQIWMVKQLTKHLFDSVKLVLGAPISTTVEGTLTAVCPVTSLVMINTRGDTKTSGLADYRTIPTSQIKSFECLKLASAEEREDAKPVAVDEAKLDAKLAARIKALKEEMEERPNGVSKEAQQIFDAFKRINMPVRWHNDSIIVHDAVIINSPYNVEDCRGPNDKRDAVTQVKKALEGEKRKMREKEAAATAGERKGG